MNPTLRLVLVPALLLALAAPLRADDTPADAPAATPTVDVDGGRFVVFSHGEPVATETFRYRRHDDSLFVLSDVHRNARGHNGAPSPYLKHLAMVLRASDGELLGYSTLERFDGHDVQRTLIVSDTAVTVNTQKDQYGTADKVVRPPGRFHVMDPGVFELFDVLARDLHGRVFGPRPVGLVTLGEQTASVEATVEPAGRDTLRWGARTVKVERLSLTDSSSTFVLTLSPTGQLLRLESAAADLVVLREPPAADTAPRRRRPAPR